MPDFADPFSIRKPTSPFGLHSLVRTSPAYLHRRLLSIMGMAGVKRGRAPVSSDGCSQQHSRPFSQSTVCRIGERTLP